MSFHSSLILNQNPPPQISSTPLPSPPITFYRSRLLPASPPLLQVSTSLLVIAAPSRSIGVSTLVVTVYLLLSGVIMGRSLLSMFLLLPLLFSLAHAAPSFHGIWNLALPHSASTESAAVPDHFPHGELRSGLPTTGEAGDQGAGDVVDHSKVQVDAGTKAWPFAYYTRRDREGTLDWGTKSWPYIYFSKKEEKGDLTASSDAAAAAVNYGRKAAGHGFRL